LAGTNAQRRRLGDGIDWGSVINNAITTGGKVAAIAETPTPTISTVYPGGITSTATGGATLPAAGAIAGIDSNSLWLLGGAALLVLLVMRGRS
jgi:hypothetical protein